ncbi:MAG: MFS transporter [Frankiales bacterium]|nr:MFS transporter [Frankiales bacterium]
MTSERKLWRNRNFVLLWIGQGLSDTGGAASALAYPLLVLALTGSPTTAGIVGTVAAAVGVAVRVPAGALVDQLDRRRLMVGCDAVRFAGIAALAAAVAAGHVWWPIVLVVACIDATGDVLIDAASYAVMPVVLPDDQLESGWAAVQARSQASSIGGPPLGGALFDVARAFPFIADAVSYLASLLSLAALRGDFRSGAATEEKLQHRIREGWSHIWRTPILRAFAIQTPLVNFAYAGVVFTVPVALRVHHVAGSVIGAVLITLSVGPLVGSLAAPWISRRVPLPVLVTAIPLSSSILFGAAAVLVPSPWMALPLAGVGLLAPSVNVALISRVTRAVPGDMLGRVFSNLQFTASSLGAAAPLVAGVLVAKANGHIAIAAFVLADVVAAVTAVTHWSEWGAKDSTA